MLTFSCLLLSFVAYHQFSNLATKRAVGAGDVVLIFSCLLLSFVAYHQFSILSSKTVPVLRKQLKSRKEKRRCSCCA